MNTRQTSFRHTLSLLFAAMVSLPILAAEADEKQPAFPGAEGFGRYVTGGRGGAVYHVTSLADDGSEGTLRWALGKSGTKTIVFDVSGTIHLQSSLNVSIGNVTIAGQTAPGDGICVADYPFQIKANNVILRYMRFRVGNKNVTLDGADGWDGLGAMDQENIIVDHCTASWSIDECLSIYGVKNSTVQWCISSQSLVNSGHSKGAHGYGGNWGGSGITYHHNLMAHHESRVPRLGPRYTTQLDERMDMRNNVFYNWGGNGCYGGEAMNVNIVNNYYKPGPGTAQISTTKQKRIAAINCRTTEYVTKYTDYKPTEHVWGTFYVAGNVNPKYSDVTADNWKYGIRNQIDTNGNDGTFNDDVEAAMKLAEPIEFVHVTTHTAEQAYEKVLAYAGCCKSRDTLDELIVGDTKDGTATYTGSGNHKGMINTTDDMKPADAGYDWSPLPVLNSTTAPKDSDGDGMPDEWEEANGLNANDASDGSAVASDGYTNLEVYLNSLVADITEACLADGTVEGVDRYADDEVVVAEYVIGPSTANGDWTYSNGIAINAQGKSYSEGKTAGFKGTKYSNNVVYTINLPEGVTIDKIKFEGYCNEDNTTGYIEQINDMDCGTDYPFPTRTGLTEPASYMVSLDTPATGSITFKCKKQHVLVITLYVQASTGIGAVTMGNCDKRQAIFSLDGRYLGNDAANLHKGIYIIGDKKLIVK